MSKVAEEFEQVKAELDKKKQQNYGEKLFAYQGAFRKILSGYQREMQTKYDTSIMEYNENAAIYKLKIEKYLETNPEESARYYEIKKKLKIRPEESKTKEEGQSKMPSRFPFGTDKF